tara:strand:+ start:68 stop:385 length:318 start_codon:yes stop_codon:yes gene_type:complete
MTHFEIASSIEMLMWMAGNDINGEPKTKTQFLTADSIDWVLDNAVKTIILLVPEGDRAQVMALLSDDDCSRSLYAICRTSGKDILTKQQQPEIIKSYKGIQNETF